MLRLLQLIRNVRFTEYRHETRSKRAAYYASLTFAIMVSFMISWSGFAHINHTARLDESARQLVLEQKADDLRQMLCLTNIVHHEVRGEKREVWRTTAKVILAMAHDPAFSKARTVCDLAKIGGMFSQIKFIEQIRAGTPLWPDVYHEVTSVYESDRTLPPGWQCVRGFRVSDDKLEKLSAKALKQLGFTVNATGLKYFATAMVPIDTRGSVTYYSPRGGCKNPTQTALR